MSTPKTVRKGTKKFQSILDSANNIVVLSLSNNFSGNNLDIATFKERIAEMDKFGMEYKVQETASSTTDRQFILSVHSNLWYRFSSK